MLTIIYIAKKFPVYRGIFIVSVKFPIGESWNFFPRLEHENADATIIIVGINW